MFDAYKHITDIFIKALEQDKIPWRMPWLNPNERMPYNGFTGKPYHGVNVFLLGAEALEKEYKRNVWMGFEQAAQMGGHVKKNEKHTKVIKWNVRYDKEDPDKVLYMTPMYLRVWNLEQIEGVEIPLKTRELNPIDEAEHIVSMMPERPEIRYGVSRAYYKPGEDFVHLPEINTFASDEAYYSTLFHELSHSTKAPHRLNRNLSTYDEEELVAEMAASFLCAEAGIVQETIENSVAYCQGWVSMFKDKPKMILHASGLAERAAAYITNKSTLEADKVSA